MELFRKYPCAEYDIRGTERWLERMAQEGYILCHGDAPIDCARFRRSEPRALRYRLTPAEEVRFFTSHKTRPAPEQLELCMEMGWHYVGNRNTFHIFVCDDPEAPELRTDPVVTAMALTPTVQQYIAELLLLIFCALLNGRWQDAVYKAVENNSVLFLLHPLAWLGVVFMQMLSLWGLLRLRRRLRAGSMETGTLHWRLIRVSQALILGAAIIFAVGLFPGESSDPAEHARDYMRYEDVRPDLPFADSHDLFPEFQKRYGEAFTAESWSTVLTEENWRLSDEGMARLLDDQGNTGYLRYNQHVSYTRFSLPIFARLYAWELLDGAENFASYEPLPLDDAGYDFAAACRIVNGIAVLLQQDGEVIVVYLRVDDGDHYVTEEFYTPDELANAIIP